MKFENFNDTKEKKEPSQEELDDTKNKELDEKVKNRGLLSGNDKQDLLKQVRERNFSRGLPERGTKEEIEIKSELSKKKDGEELQPERKAEASGVNDASEDLDKELDDELGKYFSHQKEEQRKKLQQEMDSLDDRFDEMMKKTSGFESEKKPENIEKTEVSESKENPDSKKQILTDAVTERREAMEEIRKLGESSGIDVSDSIADIQKEIEELEKKHS